MERFYIEVENLEKDKAKELYKEICVEIIEKNGLQDTAFGMLQNYCDARLKEQTKLDKDRHFLHKVSPIWKGIIRAVKVLKNEA